MPEKLVCVCVSSEVVWPPGTHTVAGPEAAPAPSSDLALGKEMKEKKFDLSFRCLVGGTLCLMLRSFVCLQYLSGHLKILTICDCMYHIYFTFF